MFSTLWMRIVKTLLTFLNVYMLDNGVVDFE